MMEGKERINIEHPEAWELLVSIEDKQVDYILFSPSVAGSLVIGHVERVDDSLDVSSKRTRIDDSPVCQ